MIRYLFYADWLPSFTVAKDKVYLKADIERADLEYDAALEKDKRSGKREGDGPNLIELHEVCMFTFPVNIRTPDTQ